MTNEDPKGFIYTNPFPLDDGKDTLTQQEIRDSVVMPLIKEFIIELETPLDFEKIWTSILIEGHAAKLAPAFLQRLNKYKQRIKGIIEDLEKEALNFDHTEPVDIPKPEIPERYRSSGE